ncbi:MAG: hypothetical protein J0L55_08170 [Caulobacterales bacterium]|nr:hypothetical protein [Caulobacterales bacterium]MCA0371218.1 hypothetical protein [Pseudomonadota bacterium]
METDFTPIQIAILTAFVCSFLCTRLLITAHLNDSPDDKRKLHNDHKATSGGLAIIFGFAVSTIYMLINTSIMVDNQIYITLGIGACFGLIGLLDDLFTLKTSIRLVLAIFIAACVAGTNLRVEKIILWENIILPLGMIFGAFGTILWIVYMINAVNFMDGVNGISLGSMAVSFFGLAFLTFHHGDLNSSVMMLCLACAGLGFLVYNVVQGSIFAGDSGSYFYGGTFAIMGLYAVRAGVSPFAIGLCVLPIISETIFTILRRIKLGENIFSAHNKHLYQIIARSGKPHLYVASIWWAMTLICVVIANIIDTIAPKYILFGFVILVLVYGIGAKIMRPKLLAEIPN